MSKCIVNHIFTIFKVIIGNLEDRLHELRQRTKSFDPDDVPCAIDMEICNVEQKLGKEYANIGISMTSLSGKTKEAWK